MAQTSAEVSVSGSAAITTADLAANKLWEYQLRRENKVILQEIREAAKRREANNAEAERKTNVLDARIAALEAKVAEFERMYKEDEKARAKWNEEAVALRSAMAGFLASQMRTDDVHHVINGKNPVVHVPTTPIRSPRVDKRPSDRSNRYVNSAERDAHPKQRDPNATRKPRPAPVAVPRPTSFRRPATRSRSKLQSPSHPVDATPVLTPMHTGVVPPLSQGRASMMSYYANANATFQNTPNNDNGRFNVDFVNTFLRGITSIKTKDKLIGELQQLHPSRVKADGWIEIICEWSDVEDGMRRAHVWGEADKETTSKKRKGRIMNPRHLMDPRNAIETGL